MPTINGYLTFNGNCRQAMTFYKKCFGGELFFQTIDDSPLSAALPKPMKKIILHSILKSDRAILMASDMVEEKGLVKGNAMALLLNCTSEKELKSYYKKLSVKRIKSLPIEKNFYGVVLGSITDQFGVHWMLSFIDS
ncbi:VOC family protein [Flavobacterium sp. '19STA2R22 D10 B1']|uniref:VOC family protein n=1 Tax=Flavobacterium aerium TaxID=3037261 RepID=UPI00278BB0DE|nr:VOC family protein [Flavobacterium sp. '19STA2R22 D10 B1']